MSEQKQPQSNDQSEDQDKDQQPTASEPDSATVLPRDLTYNSGTVENPEEVLSRPNVTPQPQADNERAM